MARTFLPWKSTRAALKAPTSVLNCSFSRTWTTRVVLIPPRRTLRHLDAGTNPPATWKARTFNDSAWREGRGRSATDWTGTYDVAIRNERCGEAHHLLLPSFLHGRGPTLFGEVRVNFQRDDGAVIYLNGADVLRTNMAINTITANRPCARRHQRHRGNELASCITLHERARQRLECDCRRSASIRREQQRPGFDLELDRALQPRLTITRSNLAHRLRWPATAPGFRLQLTRTSSPRTGPLGPASPSCAGGSTNFHITNIATRSIVVWFNHEWLAEFGSVSVSCFCEMFCHTLAHEPSSVCRDDRMRGLICRVL